MKKILTLLIALTALSACGKTQELTLLHVNDTHSHFLEHDKDGVITGGAARLFTYTQKERAAQANLLLLHAGDMITGTVFSALYKGEISIELFNRMGFSAMAVGNHEFDYGMDNLTNICAEADFPLLSANLSDDGGNPLFQTTLSTNIAGADVLIVGMTTSDWGVFQPFNRGAFGLENEYTCLSNLFYNERIDESNDIIILLSHCGYSEDLLLAEAFPKIDVIVGGHSHTKMEEAEKINGVLIVQSGKNGDHVGNLRLRIRNGKIRGYDYELVLLDESIEKNEEIAAFLDEKEQIILDTMSDKICDSDFFLDNATLRTECVPLGNFVADVLNTYADADFSIVNAGMIRNYIPSGEIQTRHVFEAYPFDNELYIVKLSGESLKKIMARGIDRLGYGAFLYYSEGIEIIAQSSSNFTATLRGEAIEDDRIYTVGVDGFLYQGGDLYTWFADEALESENSGQLIRDLITTHLTGMGTLSEESIGTEVRVLVKN